jgi:hypothetical protein
MRAIGLLVLPLLFASPGRAQSPRPLVGIGIEAAHLRDNTAWTPGITAQLGLEFPFHSERLALRLEGGFFARDQYAFTGSAQSSTTHAALALRLNLATGGLRPYLLAGASYQRITALRVGLDGTGNALRTGLVSYAGAGLFGVGLDRQVAGVRAFVEARAFVYTAPAAQTFARWMLPVTVGVSF